MWIWQHENWPNYAYDADRFAGRVADFYRKSERLSGRVEALPENYQSDALVDLMVSEAIQTSAIEGETLDRDSVRLSIKAFAGFAPAHAYSSDPKASGIAALMVDVRQHWDQPLTDALLGKWQSMVIADQPTSLLLRGAYRVDPSPMQIVAGPYGRTRVHYEAPPAERVPDEMAHFLEWYNETSPMKGGETIPGPIRAGIAHAWFENIHSFDDGNGRVGRAIADHALSQSLGFPTLTCLATAIEQNRKDYYAELEHIGRGIIDANRWLNFFVDVVNEAQDLAKQEVDFVLGKARFYDQFRGQLNERQAKVVARIYAEGTKGFEGGLSTKKYEIIAECPNRTASRDLADLLEKGVIVASGKGRSTRYDPVTVEPAIPLGWSRDRQF